MLVCFLILIKLVFGWMIRGFKLFNMVYFEVGVGWWIGSFFIVLVIVVI